MIFEQTHMWLPFKENTMKIMENSGGRLLTLDSMEQLPTYNNDRPVVSVALLEVCSAIVCVRRDQSTAAYFDLAR